MTAHELLVLERRIWDKHIERARRELERELQKAAAAVPVRDKAGARLTHRERTTMQARSCFGTLRLDVVSGYSKAEGRSLTPAREALFGGRRSAMTPMLTRNVAHLGLEAGSFEKASRLCADWNVSISDDLVMDTVREVGRRCRPELLPKRCADAAGPEDSLILMGDGWNARHRGPKWGKKGAAQEEKIDWKDIKSAVIFKAAHVVEAGRGRRALLTRHTVAMPADAGPERYGEALEREAVRMGLNEARKAYFYSDGGVYLWNQYDYRFRPVAEGTLDYYHAMEHVAVAAASLIPDETERAAWLKTTREQIRTEGGRTLHERLARMLKGRVLPAEAVKDAEREIKYFEKHKEHMDYDKRKKEGMPIGSGAVESLCGQFQDRLKRRGQFWSREGFEPILQAYVWHMNDELDYATAPPAA